MKHAKHALDTPVAGCGMATAMLDYANGRALKSRGH